MFALPSALDPMLVPADGSVSVQVSMSILSSVCFWIFVCVFVLGSVSVPVTRSVSVPVSRMSVSVCRSLAVFVSVCVHASLPVSLSVSVSVCLSVVVCGC